MGPGFPALELPSPSRSGTRYDFAPSREASGTVMTYSIAGPKTAEAPSLT